MNFFLFQVHLIEITEYKLHIIRGPGLLYGIRNAQILLYIFEKKLKKII